MPRARLHPFVQCFLLDGEAKFATRFCGLDDGGCTFDQSADPRNKIRVLFHEGGQICRAAFDQGRVLHDTLKMLLNSTATEMSWLQGMSKLGALSRRRDMSAQ